MRGAATISHHYTDRDRAYRGRLPAETHASKSRCPPTTAELRKTSLSRCRNSNVIALPTPTHSYPYTVCRVHTKAKCLRVRSIRTVFARHVPWHLLAHFHAHHCANRVCVAYRNFYICHIFSTSFSNVL